MTFSVCVRLTNVDYRGPNQSDEKVTEKPKRGDIVHVQNVDSRWGKCESLQAWIAAGEEPGEYPGTFGVIRVIDGDTTAEGIWYKLLQAGHRDRNPLDDNIPGKNDGEQLPVRIHRHVWRLKLSELTESQAQTFQETGELDITEAEFNELCEHKIDRTVFDPSAEMGKGRRRNDANGPLMPEQHPGVKVGRPL